MSTENLVRLMGLDDQRQFEVTIPVFIPNSTVPRHIMTLVWGDQL